MRLTTLSVTCSSWVPAVAWASGLAGSEPQPQPASRPITKVLVRTSTGTERGDLIVTPSWRVVRVGGGSVPFGETAPDGVVGVQPAFGQCCALQQHAAVRGQVNGIGSEVDQAGDPPAGGSPAWSTSDPIPLT